MGSGDLCIQRVKRCVPLDDSLEESVLRVYYVDPEDGIQESGSMAIGCAHCSVTEPFAGLASRLLS